MKNTILPSSSWGALHTGSEQLLFSCNQQLLSQGLCILDVMLELAIQKEQGVTFNVINESHITQGLEVARGLVHLGNQLQEVETVKQ
ncbi:hypothetical protein OPW41_08850 [Vibrio europaeus]|uniref:hypothetical protein n=1 Tax=Vibrio europaeus TaxID=300876 RepID=UPI00233EBFFF|nr:hypothetical protein [Vibrio europaeus]MDC5755215.1 hypothetical protein [Vibrio europaeus]MDC5775794.1 hypothetical protein [Vibrio europaeus]MDC5794932.1 hypothetical protein [Vibrio europaeus]MDC5799503.1 hypothetical protein [Vibrio europaeus]MDC5817211.1 hypothetical protein [Vibrio europaeus]